jgi:hypothetical protein
MKLSMCDRDEETLAALQSGNWDAGLAQHTSGCTLCQEVILVAKFLKQEAVSAGMEVRLPSAAFIWWQAEIARRNKAVQRATQVTEVFTRIAYLTGGFAALWFISARIISAQTISNFTAGAALWGGVLTLMTFLLGSFYLLWAD